MFSKVLKTLLSLTLIAITYNLIFAFKLSFVDFSKNVFYTCIIGAVIVAVIIYLTRFKKNVFYPVLYLLFIVPSIFIVDTILSKQHKQSLDKGNKIIVAIEKFKESNKNIPKTLGELIPNYLNEIPKYNLGFRSSTYNYQVKDNGEYSFYFNSLHGSYYAWDQEGKKWYTYD
jgi:hypothetical protein